MILMVLLLPRKLLRFLIDGFLTFCVGIIAIISRGKITPCLYSHLFAVNYITGKSKGGRRGELGRSLKPLPNSFRPKRRGLHPSGSQSLMGVPPALDSSFKRAVVTSFWGFPRRRDLGNPTNRLSRKTSLSHQVGQDRQRTVF